MRFKSVGKLENDYFFICVFVCLFVCIFICLFNSLQFTNLQLFITFWILKQICDIEPNNSFVQKIWLFLRFEPLSLAGHSIDRSIIDHQIWHKNLHYGVHFQLECILSLLQKSKVLNIKTFRNLCKYCHKSVSVGIIGRICMKVEKNAKQKHFL